VTECDDLKIVVLFKAELMTCDSDYILLFTSTGFRRCYGNRI